MKNDGGIDTQYTKNATCPYCGHEDKDSWEIEFDGMEGDTTNICGKCEKEYTVSRHVEITYCSFKEESNEE